MPDGTLQPAPQNVGSCGVKVMLTLASANRGVPVGGDVGAEGLPAQPVRTPKIATHTSAPERVIAPPVLIVVDEVSC